MKAREYNSSVVKPILALETRSDKLGNIFFYVEYLTNDGSYQYVTFEKMTSVIDFINSNF